MRITLEIGGFTKEFNSIEEAHKALDDYSQEKAEAIERAEKFNKVLRERCCEWALSEDEKKRLDFTSRFELEGPMNSESHWLKETQEKQANAIIGAVRKLIRLRLGGRTNSNLETLIKGDVDGECFLLLDDILPPRKKESDEQQTQR